MFYQPKVDVDQSHDSALYYFEGVHYLFVMYRSPRQETPGCDGISLATSTDGVHFAEVGPILNKADDAEAIGGITRPWRAAGKFLMGFSERRSGVQSIFFAESGDLIHWARLGEEFRFDPDPRWYDDTPVGRWDDLWVLSEDDGGYRGYLTARTLYGTPGIAFESICMAQSDDGIRWHAIAPPTFDWGEWPPMSIGEVAGVEKLGDRYYMIQHFAEHMLGNRQVREHPGRTEGMYVFIAESPDGPFRPDVEGFRFPPSYNVFTRFYRAGDDMLINHKSVERCGPGATHWTPPLKKAVLTPEGHLRMGYWNGNDAAKGEKILIDLSDGIVLGVPEYAKDHDGDWVITKNHVRANQVYGGGVALLAGEFDLDRGIIIEGAFTLSDPPKGWSGAGIYIEYDSERREGTGILVQTRGKTELGPFRAVGATKVLSYPTFKPDDIIDQGIVPDRKCSFRLLARKTLVEFYLDDLLLQCHSLPKVPTGVIGLVVESGTAIFEDLKAWEMNL